MAPRGVLGLTLPLTSRATREGYGWFAMELPKRRLYDLRRTVAHKGQAPCCTRDTVTRLLALRFYATRDAQRVGSRHGTLRDCGAVRVPYSTTYVITWWCTYLIYIGLPIFFREVVAGAPRRSARPGRDEILQRRSQYNTSEPSCIRVFTSSRLSGSPLGTRITKRIPSDGSRSSTTMSGLPTPAVSASTFSVLKDVGKLRLAQRDRASEVA